MDIRVATHEDVESILDLLERIERKDRKNPNNEYEGLPIVRHHTQRTLHEMIDNPSAVVLFTDHGVAAYEVHSTRLNFSRKVAGDVIFRTDGSDGIKLLRMIEKWAVDIGATHVSFGAKKGLSRESGSRDRVMDRLGYEPFETHWYRTVV